MKNMSVFSHVISLYYTRLRNEPFSIFLLHSISIHENNVSKHNNIIFFTEYKKNIRMTLLKNCVL